MGVTATSLQEMIECELAGVGDARVVRHVRRQLVEPRSLLLKWDYGEPDQEYPGWIVLQDMQSGAEIAYCEQGFGPRSPWGLVDSQDRHIGMDSGWFPSFMEAFFESFASVELPIWKVIKVEADGARTHLTEEGDWDPTWKRVYELRASDPAGRYECHHDIDFGKS
jgi:hypothetical protein